MKHSVLFINLNVKYLLREGMCKFSVMYSRLGSPVKNLRVWADFPHKQR